MCSHVSFWGVRFHVVTFLIVYVFACLWFVISDCFFRLLTNFSIDCAMFVPNYTICITSIVCKCSYCYTSFFDTLIVYTCLMFCFCCFSEVFISLTIVSIDCASFRPKVFRFGYGLAFSCFWNLFLMKKTFIHLM